MDEQGGDKWDSNKNEPDPLSDDEAIPSFLMQRVMIW